VGLKTLKNSPPEKRLVGVKLEGRRTARAGADVFSNGERIGTVTSGVFSPTLQRSIALAYITPDFQTSPGTLLDLSVGRGTIPGDIVDTPFHKNGTVRMEI
ncbi:MAG: hypothetical protein KAG97_04900, partial [Victivallales bacterium]|nr:hypothetical protein [Victivallales bacterium]